MNGAVRFLKKKDGGEGWQDTSWGNEGEGSHSMWSEVVKKLLRKAGLC